MANIQYRQHGPNGYSTLITLSQEETDALSIALSMVFGTEDLDEVFGQALMHYKKETD